MKKIELLVLCFILVCSCEVIQQGDISFTKSTQLEQNEYVPIFNEDLCAWMVQQDDVFEVGAFRLWCESLMHVYGYKDVFRVETTHYCITAFPKTIDELNRIKKEEDITISYFPFNYRLLPENKDYKSGKVFKQKKYSEYMESHTIDGRSEVKKVDLPVLYISWPVSKALPDYFEYVIDYEAYHPDFYDLTDEQEALLNHIGDIPCNETLQTTSSYVNRHGTIKYYDNFLRDYVPQPGLKQRFQLGSAVIHECFTGEDGCFDVTSPVPASAGLYHVFETDKWYITDSLNISIPVCLYVGNVGGLWPNGAPSMEISPTSSTYAYDINPYVYYFYHSDSLVTRSTQNYSVRITSMQKSGDGILGYTKWHQNIPYIEIFDDNMYRINYESSTIFHELGHVNMWYGINSVSSFNNTKKLFHESYASYVGWRVANEYYVNLGLVVSSPNTDFGGRYGRQNWRPTDYGNVYSPFFIDLVDSYNQYSNTYVETVSGFPDDLIYDMITTCCSWDDYNMYLRRCSGMYFTNGQFLNFSAPYNVWFSNNNL